MSTNITMFRSWYKMLSFVYWRYIQYPTNGGSLETWKITSVLCLTFSKKGYFSKHNNNNTQQHSCCYFWSHLSWVYTSDSISLQDTFTGKSNRLMKYLLSGLGYWKCDEINYQIPAFTFFQINLRKVLLSTTSSIFHFVWITNRWTDWG